jgi:hypothetical protein
MGAAWWMSFGIALTAIAIALWANDRRKAWAGAATIFAVVATLFADPIQAIILAFDLPATRRRGALARPAASL